ncbi:endonuclease III domain-containing protein [Methylobacterium sp. J-070]|uniref:endonuclease III domain-containing protein n=1 Tax=Methylobacterium sp. J-070 TaxID=2836650 RepID=UPI001FB90061|nr:Fe-S cluster assembly protein HesB [Methylobacterium sp. J-070]MCJ2052221.1 Fe-S cluster assembly protein HesB [Methylobacterium sp. J-070]
MPSAAERTPTTRPVRRPPSPAPADPAVAGKALAVHARLCPVYGCPIPYFHSLDPVSELVSSLLSHRTRNAESGRAFKALRARFADWDSVIEAGLPEIEAAIAGVTWPELKAPRIRDVLRAVRERCGSLDLAFLARMDVEAARAWLQAIPGIGPKTSAAVLSFSTLRMPALPVDSHHHRVAQRLGLIGPRVDVGPSHAILRAQLPAEWSAQDLYDNHEILMLHGQQVCHHRRPACGRCVLVDLCPSAMQPTREP